MEWEPPYKGKRIRLLKEIEREIRDDYDCKKHERQRIRQNTLKDKKFENFRLKKNPRTEENPSIEEDVWYFTKIFNTLTLPSEKCDDIKISARNGYYHVVKDGNSIYFER